MRRPLRKVLNAVALSQKNWPFGDEAAPVGVVYD